jgi:hypothetical protein
VEITTSWVKPPKAIGGLDHLAVQAPCINLYGQMLPGITNVTDRARYYSFYPWIVWALDKRECRYDNTFIDLFRKSDCLFTLIAERHAKVIGDDRDDHAAATIGSGNMSEAISRVRDGYSVRLSDHACREGKTRYFKNKLGGLGQYYIGVLRELQVMDGDLQSGVKNIREVGGLMAEAFSQNVDTGLFLRTLDEDIVSAERLDELSPFCPCCLTSNVREHEKLSDLFFVRGQFYNQKAIARRHTLQMILSLANNLAENKVAIDIEQFRGCTYSGALPNKAIWYLPSHLQKNRKQWAVYQRNEILSLAVQGIFYVLLDTYEESGERFQSVDELVRWFVQMPEVELSGSFFPLNSSVSAVRSEASSWLAHAEDWTNDDHEICLMTRIEALCSGEKSTQSRAAVLLDCLKILIALQNRQESKEGYGDFVFPPNYLKAYPINLETFDYHSNSTWVNLSIREWVAWLAASWGIDTHLLVALRKLRGQSQSTFRIRPSDSGFEIVSVSEAVFTSPRFRQALRILKDIGALIKRDNLWVPSDLGRQFMESLDE